MQYDVFTHTSQNRSCELSQATCSHENNADMFLMRMLTDNDTRFASFVDCLKLQLLKW